ncbi:DNA alkylation repair protein [Niveibacterium umoris]|uniref:3-methyladenine DNA glycosylase AlkD n=1 Tax=Niveibacterium umoris TaxID=1193620 RepID=A0A840BQP3_9RHOO|nr:DNA alkylation repair protein [Niveibacterium umoris]MBB4013789.1 3-methyladenine DNA glycosylase AlkD [Niveibacterium umoris]
MDTTRFCSSVSEALLPLASPERQAPMQAYMKDRFAFLGVATPARRAATMPLIRALKAPTAADLLATAGALWQMPAREFQYVAVDLLARHHRRLGRADVPALLALAREKTWWDSVDGLAGVVGDVVRAARRDAPDPQACMDDAVADADFWVRRIAMLHQLGWRADTDRDRLFAYARRLAPESEFFIRKAIGWALRDYAWHDPAPVRAFVASMGTALSPLSRREATKHIG